MSTFRFVVETAHFESGNPRAVRVDRDFFRHKASAHKYARFVCTAFDNVRSSVIDVLSHADQLRVTSYRYDPDMGGVIIDPDYSG